MVKRLKRISNLSKRQRKRNVLKMLKNSVDKLIRSNNNRKKNVVIDLSNVTNVNNIHPSNSCAVVTNNLIVDALTDEHNDQLVINNNDAIDNGNRNQIINPNLISMPELLLSSDNVKSKYEQLLDFLRLWGNVCYVRKYAITMLLKGLKKIFEIKELPSDARALLKTPRSTDIIELASGIYSHYGLKKALHNQLESTDLSEIDSNKIFVQFSIDGLPLSDSSDTQLWPILGRIVGVENSKVFVVSAWYGSGKPSSANEFLEPFIHEYFELNSNGFVYKNVTYKVYLHSLIADTVARNFLCCFPAHNSRCGRCIQTGQTINHRRVFLEINSELRNDFNYRLNLPVQYQNVVSPLEGIEGISITKHVPLDPMHLFSGIMLKLGLIYYNQYGQAIDASVRQGQMNRTYIQFNAWIPDEFVRGTRTLDQISKFKCTELRLLLMYTGPVIFSNYITDEQMQNFNALNCAVRILSDPSECIENNPCAKDLMIYFVETMKKLYGDDSIIYNVHNAIHICDDVLNFGALDLFSAYPYENHLRTLKRMVVKGSYALSQIMNKINERSIISSAAPNANNVGKDKFRIVGCSKIIFKSFILSCEVPNNCCLLEDQSIVVIEKIYLRNTEPVILGRKYLDCFSLDNYPIDSRLIGINKSNRLSDLQEWSVNKIKKKYLRIFADNYYYLFPLIHTLV